MLFTASAWKKQLRNDFDAGNFRRQFANDSEKIVYRSHDLRECLGIAECGSQGGSVEMGVTSSLYWWGNTDDLKRQAWDRDLG